MVAGLAGLIRKSRGRFIVSRECRRLLSDHGPAGIYPQLLHSYARDFNWAYRDGFSDLGVLVLVTRILMELGYTVLGAKNGVEALDSSPAARRT